MSCPVYSRRSNVRAPINSARRSINHESVDNFQLIGHKTPLTSAKENATNESLENFQLRGHTCHQEKSQRTDTKNQLHSAQKSETNETKTNQHNSAQKSETNERKKSRQGHSQIIRPKSRHSQSCNSNGSGRFPCNFISVHDITELKTLTNPPTKVKHAITGLLIVLNNPCVKLQNENVVWAECRRVISYPNAVMSSIRAYRYEHVTEAIYKRLDAHLRKMYIEIPQMFSVCASAVSLWKWLLLVHAYGKTQYQRH